MSLSFASLEAALPLPLPVVVALFGLVLALGVIARPSVPRVVAKPLMTAAEMRCFEQLRRALPQYVVLSQVAMGALLAPAKGLSRSDHFRTRARFAQKIIDFVIFEPIAGNVVAVVELDDWSHDSGRDARRDAMLGRAGYKVVRIPPQPRPTVSGLRALFAEQDIGSAAIADPAPRRVGKAA